MILHAIEIYESVRFIHYYNSHEEAACIFNREREKEIKKEKKWKRKKIVTLHKHIQLSLSPSCIISIIRLLDNIDNDRIKNWKKKMKWFYTLSKSMKVLGLFIITILMKRQLAFLIERERRKLRKKIVTLHKIFKKLFLSPSRIISIIRLLDNIEEKKEKKFFHS